MLNAAKYTINPKKQEIIECFIDKKIDKIRDVHGLVHPYPRFEQKTGICVMLSITNFDEQKKVLLFILNPLIHHLRSLKTPKLQHSV